MGRMDHTRRQARSRMTVSPNIPEQRGRLIKLLEDAMMLADDLEDGNTGI